MSDPRERERERDDERDMAHLRVLRWSEPTALSWIAASSGKVKALWCLAESRASVCLADPGGACGKAEA